MVAGAMFSDLSSFIRRPNQAEAAISKLFDIAVAV
jgi:hypothetical protein